MVVQATYFYTMPLRKYKKYLPALIACVLISALIIWSAGIKTEYPQSRIQQLNDEFHKSDSLVKLQRSKNK